MILSTHEKYRNLVVKEATKQAVGWMLIGPEAGQGRARPVPRPEDKGESPELYRAADDFCCRVFRAWWMTMRKAGMSISGPILYGDDIHVIPRRGLTRALRCVKDLWW